MNKLVSVTADMLYRLKKNRVVFGLMDDDMKLALIEIGHENCEWYTGGDGWIDPDEYAFFLADAYRVRDDYPELLGEKK